MAQAKVGDVVRVHYKGYFDDGTVFDTSRNAEPFEFTLGNDMVIPGFENAILGMEVGDVRTVEISPEEGYGERREDLVIEIDKNQVPPEIQPEVGMMLQLQSGQGEAIPVMVSAIGKTTITLDGNHPLAGKKLNFEIELVEIVSG